MKYLACFKYGLMIATVLTLASCKVAVVVVEGGEVQSVGSGTCMAGSVCIHQVTDNNFSESFTAVPDLGWEFVRWNNGDGFLCGGITDPVCALSTVGTAGKPLIEAVIASDKTFPIMPVFEIVDGTVDPAGIWEGTDSIGRRVAALVLNTGEYYAVYSTLENSNEIAGLVQGTGTSSGDQFNSSDGLDFNFQGLGILAGTLNATVDYQNTFSGAVTADSEPLNPLGFNTTFSPVYNETPTLGAIAGIYDGLLFSILGGEANLVSIDSAGVIAAVSEGGCSTTGTITPRSKGNVYDVQITFGTAFCALPNQTVSGAGTYNPNEKFLIIALVTPARDIGAVYTGVKR